jgi:hypothetical protein
VRRWLPLIILAAAGPKLSARLAPRLVVQIGLAAMFSFGPPRLLERATAFRQGEALVAGKIVSHPCLVRFGARVAEEGGSDIPADWARP